MSLPPADGPLIEVVVAPGCVACGYSRGLVAQVRELRPEANIVITDRHDLVGESIIATPTYRVNGRTVALGNPELIEMLGWIDEGTSTGR